MNADKSEDGIEILRENGVLRVDYRPKGNGVIVAFLLLVSIPILIYVPRIIITEPGWWYNDLAALFRNGNYVGFAAMLLFFITAVTCGLFACLWALAFSAMQLFGVYRYEVEPTRLRFETRLFGWTKTKQFERNSIRSLQQIQDGGEGEDSFISYGLILQPQKIGLFSKAKEHALLMKQDYEKSARLGSILAQELGLPFEKATRQDA